MKHHWFEWRHTWFHLLQIFLQRYYALASHENLYVKSCQNVKVSSFVHLWKAEAERLEQGLRYQWCGTVAKTENNDKIKYANESASRHCRANEVVSSVRWLTCFSLWLVPACPSLKQVLSCANLTRMPMHCLLSFHSTHQLGTTKIYSGQNDQTGCESGARLWSQPGTK